MEYWQSEDSRRILLVSISPKGVDMLDQKPNGPSRLAVSIQNQVSTRNYYRNSLRAHPTQAGLERFQAEIRKLNVVLDSSRRFS